MTAGTSAIRDVSVDFGDGTSLALGALNGATNVTHTYNSAGSFTVIVTATDSTGAAVFVAAVIVVEGAGALNVTMTALPDPAQVDRAITFTAEVTVASGTLEIDRYEWNFGDGSTAVTTGNSTSHVYRAAGFLVVTVQVVEKDGRVGTGRVEINVLTQVPLNVNIDVDEQPATVGEVVTFTATATASGSTVSVSRYEWDFGDGATVTTSGNVASHVYAAADTYTVQVTAVTSEGVSGSTQITLIVVPLQVEVALTVSPSTANIDQDVLFTATVTPASVVVAKYDWDFGDTTDLLNGGRVTTHKYGAAGTFTVKVTVTLVDTTLGTVDTQAVVTVRP